MEILEEPIYYQNPALCIKVWEFELNTSYCPDPALSTIWHYHKEVEFIYVLKGKHEMYTPQTTYHLKAGDVLLLGSSQLHRPRRTTDEYLDFIVLHVDLRRYFDLPMMMYYRYFSEVGHSLEELNYIFKENPEVRAQVGRILIRMHEEIMVKALGYEIAASIQIRQLLLTLLRADTRGKLAAHEMVDATIMNPILDYVDQQLGEKINLEQVSKLANMSYFYFSKYFKKSIGITFTEYINRKRVAKAELLLLTSKLSVTEIAMTVGIENMAHFYELFKRFKGCTPKQYLQKMAGHNQGGLEEIPIQVPSNINYPNLSSIPVSMPPEPTAVTLTMP